MPAVVIIGAQWGDEGKGKIVDLLSSRADIVVRFQGGANAGHTIVWDGKRIVFHHIPSGILYPDKVCVLGHGMVIDPAILLKEMENLKKFGVEVNPHNLKISNRAHLVLPYHKIIDNLRESQEKQKIGTTGRGIGPAYEDKIARRGIRMCDFINPRIFKDKLQKNIMEKNNYIVQVLKGEPLSFEEVFSNYSEMAEILREYITDTTVFLNSALEKNSRVLLEGAQGTHLDIDQGTYPFVTSSNTSIGYAFAGSGISPKYLSGVVGVMKAYTTRVGEGPFPAELKDETGQTLRDKGKEYGSTTGRPRRCGWLDLVIVKRASIINGFTSLALTKLDVLSGFKTVKMVVGYKINGVKIENFPSSAEEMEMCKPVYLEIEGWESLKGGEKTFDDLPPQARKFIREIENFVGVKVDLISISAERKDTIFLRNIF